jgi:hypothetical protein
VFYKCWDNGWGFINLFADFANLSHLSFVVTTLYVRALPVQTAPLLGNI